MKALINNGNQLNKKAKKGVWLALYNPMIHESLFGVLSVHKSQKGAGMAKSLLNGRLTSLFTVIAELQIYAMLHDLV